MELRAEKASAVGDTGQPAPWKTQAQQAPWETQAQLAPWGSEVLNGQATGTAEEPMSVTANVL